MADRRTVTEVRMFFEEGIRKRRAAHCSRRVSSCLCTGHGGARGGRRKC